MGNTNAKRYGSMPRRYPSPYVNTPTCGCSVAAMPTPVEQCADMVLAMAYVPWQQLNTVYEAEDGYPRGTIFPELDKPLMVGGMCRG